MAEPRLQGIRVLVVDDTADNLDMLKILLELEGATVFAAGSAAEAYALLERETVDVLVTDIGMPGTDGFGLLRSVRAGRPDHNAYVPTVALTGYTSAQDRALTEAAGFRAHLAKPLDPDELVRVIRTLAEE